ncbi:UDP-GlcNAc:betaGal beta-1,3-N-acetylglucosaminyltransferase 3-like [Stegastes partitus]|uniref:Hexosyltransferase n=1 Tax=Stegastes partitus TaxID=144197 RepID=A0A3B5AIS2_9TELE|nr:PREDICTED: UDP-GlcNAc:betaGal beta-1,3-N-acetylglucosaminyltransferase 3-like [Stegastes partitus]
MLSHCSILRKKIFITRLLVLGVLVVVVNLWFPGDLTKNKHILLQEDVRKSLIQPKPTTTSSTYKYSWPKCRKNISAARVPGFNSLPRHIQDFLYHRHCRHFPMILDVPDKCGGAEGSAEVFLLLVIKSSPGNYNRREVLRKTWAKERLQNGVWIRRIFISGTTGDGFEKKRLNNLLEVEQHENNDILQWDFIDTHYNLTLKQVLFLEWMDVNCPHVRFLMNGDDDVFAHTDNMIDYLKALTDNDGQRHLFTGNLMVNFGPIRSPDSKYYVPVQVYESESYPDFCSGGGFLLSGYTAHVIYNMSQSITLLPMDDVYIAMCVDKAGLRPESHMGVKAFGHRSPSNNDPLDPCYFSEILLAHRFLPTDLYIMWQSLQDPSLTCFDNNKE